MSLLIAIGGGYLASRLPLRSDFASLLPTSKRSVHDLGALQKRVRPFGTIQIMVAADDAAVRAQAGAALGARLADLAADRPDLIAQYSPDEGPRYRYGWDHRFLFADQADLERARADLQARIERGKLDSNPLYIDLDDDDDDTDTAAATDDELADLERKLDEAEGKAKAPPPRVSADGRLQLLVVQTAFRASDARRARALIATIRGLIAEVRREVGAGVEFGLAGNVTFTMYEHDSVLEGMWQSALITLVLCGLGLMFYYRSGRLVLAMLASLAVGVAATFAVAWLAIGHLNVMTAFLAAIVIGNGVNAELLLVARYQDELRDGREPRAAIAPAIAGALPGTLAATFAAAAAYASLMIADFRGFREFGALAGVGMMLTWVTTFTVLPALLAVLARRGRIRLTSPPAIGAVLSWLLPARRLGAVVVVGVGIAVLAAAMSVVYLANDPFTRDWRDLQSRTDSIRRANAIDRRIRAAIDPTAMLTGQTYLVVIAVPDRAQVGPLVARIRADDAARPPVRRWLTDVRSIEDLLPPDQAAKLTVLAELRALIDDPALQATLSDDERARLARLRPADDLRPLTDADVPLALAWPFTERDGTVGRLIVLRGSGRFRPFNVRDRLVFANEVGRIELPPGAIVAAETLIVADVVRSMEHDAPRMIAFALIGSVVVVVMVMGLRRHGLVTLASAGGGVTLMIALCALVGLKVHFLDLIALPITIGIGIDYAVNLAARDRQEGERGLDHVLRTTGATVLLCSYTTAVGYGALLLSANGGIRAFGLAALLGEIACITMALIVAPAALTLLRARADRRAALAPAAPAPT